MHLSELMPQVGQAVRGFLEWLDGRRPADDESWDELARRYGEIKSRLGRQAVAGRMALTDGDLAAFDSSLREAMRRLQRCGEGAGETETRNAAIAALRLLSWLEAIAQRTPELAFDLALPVARGEEIGRRQVRALELILRSLITEHYENQAALIARLKELLSEKVVQQWLAAADRDDLLSGTSFSELASLFVAKEEFPGYEPFYRDTPFLTLLSEKRVTIRHYLDDIRRIRNALAHNKRVTPLQIALLDLYYEELVEPLQEAFDQGRTTVNPDLHLDASAAELDAYFSRLGSDLQGVRDDLASLREELLGRLDQLAGETAALRQSSTRIESGTRRANRRLLAIGAGVVAVALLAGTGIWLGRDTRDSVEAVRRTTEATQEAVIDMAEGLKRLANQGGLVAEPRTPAELYHNARLLAQRGEIDQAIDSYRQLFTFDIPYADPVLDLVALLRAKYGAGGAAAALETVLPPETDPRTRAFAFQAAGGETPMVAAKRLAEEVDPYPPALWLAVEGLMGLPYDRFSFGLRKLAVLFMDQVQQALDDGTLARLYLDQIRLDAIRQQLATYRRQFPSDALPAFDKPLDADWETFTWVDGQATLRVMFMWNPAAAAFNRVDPAELWVRFVALPGWPKDGAEAWINIFDPQAALRNQQETYPPDMEVPPDLQKMVLDLVAGQNPMAYQFYLPQPDAPFVLAEIKFTEVGDIPRHLCLAIPNSNGGGYVEYRTLADCGVEP